MRRDPFSVLRLPRGATLAEIREAYRRLAKMHHPDRGGSEDEFLEIKDAYEALKDGDWVAPAAPYLAPDTINWTTAERSTPDPVVVRLGNRGGIESVSEFGPDRMRGEFWAIESSLGVMEGELLYEFTFVPRVSSLTPGKYRDVMSFEVDGKAATLPLRIHIKPAAVRAATGRPKRAPTSRAPTRSVSWSDIRTWVEKELAGDSVAVNLVLVIGSVIFWVMPFLIGKWADEVQHHSGALTLGDLFVDLFVVAVVLVCGVWVLAGFVAIAVSVGRLFRSIGREIARMSSRT